MDNKEKQYKLEQILKEIAKDNLFKSQSRYICNFTQIYSNDFRHEYSTITRVLMSISDSEERDYLIEKIKIILGKINNPQVQIKVEKLLDHINLENIRMAELYAIANRLSQEARETEKSVKMSEDKFKDIEQKYNETNKLLTDIKQNVKNSTTESITILSIFAGVVMAFTGGFSYISQAIASLNEIGPYRAGAFIILIGMIMFDIIFLLLYMIGKLTERYIGSRGKCNSLENGCNNKDIWCSVNRYPYVVWFNIISLMMIVTILNVYCIDRYDYLAQIYIYVFEDFKAVKLCAYLFFLLFILTYIPFGVIMHKIKDNKCNCEQ